MHLRLLILLSLLPFYNFSQVNGKVYNIETNEFIIGAKISDHQGNKALSDLNGIFTLNVNSFPDTLFTQFLGFDTDTTIITSTDSIFIFLQPTVKSLEGVVISAGRRQQNVEELPISMEIIKPALIDNKGITDLEQAVDQSPGVYAMDGQVSIRGGSGFSYGAGSRVLLLWNGIPMLSGDAGDTKWNSIPMEQASQIEILKGASSVLYGSGALNGIIALTEKEPSTKGETKAKLMSGIYDNPKRESLKWWNKNPMLYQVEAYHGKMKKNFGYTVSVNGFKNQGFREGETEDRARLSGLLLFKPSGNTKLKTGLAYNLQFQKTGNFIIWESDSLGYQPSGGADTSVAGSTLTYNKGIRLSVDPYIKYIDGRNNRHSLKTRVYFIDNANLSNTSQNTTSTLYFGDYQFQRTFKNKINVTAGATNIYNSVNSALFGDHFSYNAAFYGQYEQKIGKLDVTGGIRFEYFEQDNKRGDSDFYLGKDSLKLSMYPILRAGLHYELAKYTHLRASYGQGVRYPSVAERFTKTNVGSLNIFPNPDLRPEIGWAAEIGVKQIVKMGDWKGMIDLAGFINQYENMMEFTFDFFPDPNITLYNFNPESPAYLFNFFGFQARNAEKARITGLEVSFNSKGKIKNVEIVSLIGYTYMNPVSLNRDTVYLENFSDSGSTMLKYRFKHLAKADIEATWRKISLGASMRYNSFMSNIDAIFEDGVAGTQILEGLKEYRQENNTGNIVFDVRAGYSFSDIYRIGFMVNNLLNEEYSTRPGDIQAPRTFLLQLQVKL